MKLISLIKTALTAFLILFVISAAHYTTRLTYKVHEVLRGSHNDNFVTFTDNAAASYYESADLKWVIFYFPIEGDNNLGAPYFHDQLLLICECPCSFP